MKTKRLYILILALAMVSCSKVSPNSGRKTVDKLNHEINNSSIQFTLSNDELAILKKAYSELNEDEIKLYEKIYNEYLEFKEKNNNDVVNFENDILRLQKEKDKLNKKNDVDFKKESSKKVKLEEKTLEQNSITNLADLGFYNDGYLIKLSGNGEFIFKDNNKEVLREKINSEDIYIRVFVSETSSVEIKGDLKGIIFKDNISYNELNILPTGTFFVGTDIEPGVYDFTTNSENTKIKLITYDMSNPQDPQEIVKNLETKDLTNLELKDSTQIIISGIDNVNIKKIK